MHLPAWWHAYRHDNDNTRQPNNLKEWHFHYPSIHFLIHISSWRSQSCLNAEQLSTIRRREGEMFFVWWEGPQGQSHDTRLHGCACVAKHTCIRCCQTELVSFGYIVHTFHRLLHTCCTHAAYKLWGNDCHLTESVELTFNIKLMWCWLFKFVKFNYCVSYL